MSKDTLEPQQIMGYSNLKFYIGGFLVSLLLTLFAYFIVVESLLGGWVRHLSVAGLGLIQAWIQLVFFLHLGKEPKPRWNLVIFLFTIMITLILVFGSIWIMNNLDYNLMGS